MKAGTRLYFVLCLLKSAILSSCSLWAIAFHFDIDLLRTKDILKELDEISFPWNLKQRALKENMFFFFFNFISILWSPVFVSHCLESLKPSPWHTVWQWVHAWSSPFWSKAWESRRVTSRPLLSQSQELKSALGMEWLSCGSRYEVLWSLEVSVPEALSEALVCGSEWESPASAHQSPLRNRVVEKRLKELVILYI